MLKLFFSAVTPPCMSRFTSSINHYVPIQGPDMLTVSRTAQFFLFKAAITTVSFSFFFVFLCYVFTLQSAARSLLVYLGQLSVLSQSCWPAHCYCRLRAYNVPVPIERSKLADWLIKVNNSRHKNNENTILATFKILKFCSITFFYMYPHWQFTRTHMPKRSVAVTVWYSTVNVH